MRIAVTTPTGNVGSHLVRSLVRAGVRPLLLLRDAGKLDPELREVVEVREGDLGDPAYVLEATAGADALYWVDPTNFGVDDPNAAAERLGGFAADAIRTNGIARTVFQSSIGAEKRHGAGLIDGMARVEEKLDATGADVLHLRCGFFMANLLMDLDGLRGGTVSTNKDPDGALPWVDPRDIAEVAAARLLAGSWSGTAVQAVHGAADLTWPEVTEILSAATGRELRLEVVSDESVRDGLLASGMPEGAATGMVEMTSGLRGFTPELPRTAATTTPTTLAAWAYDTLRPALSTPART